MSCNSGEQQQFRAQAGQNRPNMSVVLMLLSGLLLVALLFIPSDGRWWLPTASDKGNLLALVFAGMALANSLLKNHDLDSFDKEFPTIAIALMAWAVVFVTTATDADGSLGSSVFTLLAVIPVLVAVVGPWLSRQKQEYAFVLKVGLVTYLAALVILPVYGQSVGTSWQVIIGVICILGASVAIGVAVGGVSRLITDWRALSRFRKGKK